MASKPMYSEEDFLETIFRGLSYDEVDVLTADEMVRDLQNEGYPFKRVTVDGDTLWAPGGPLEEFAGLLNDRHYVF